MIRLKKFTPKRSNFKNKRFKNKRAPIEKIFNLGYFNEVVFYVLLITKPLRLSLK